MQRLNLSENLMRFLRLFCFSPNPHYDSEYDDKDGYPLRCAENADAATDGIPSEELQSKPEHAIGYRPQAQHCPAGVSTSGHDRKDARHGEFKCGLKKLHGQKRNSIGGNWRMRVGNSQCFGKRTIAAAHAEAAKPSKRVE